MIDEQKLYELLKDFDPAVGERMEKHFKDGAFYSDSFSRKSFSISRFNFFTIPSEPFSAKWGMTV